MTIGSSHHNFTMEMAVERHGGALCLLLSENREADQVQWIARFLDRAANQCEGAAV